MKKDGEKSFKIDENVVSIGSDYFSENNTISMRRDDFFVEDNFENVPYLNNNSDIIQDRLGEIEKNTKNIQENLVSSNDGNIIGFKIKTSNVFSNKFKNIKEKFKKYLGKLNILKGKIY